MQLTHYIFKLSTYSLLLFASTNRLLQLNIYVYKCEKKKKKNNMYATFFVKNVMHRFTDAHINTRHMCIYIYVKRTWDEKTLCRVVDDTLCLAIRPNFLHLINVQRSRRAAHHTHAHIPHFASIFARQSTQCDNDKNYIKNISKKKNRHERRQKKLKTKQAIHKFIGICL